jgi:hypothetical protein
MGAECDGTFVRTKARGRSALDHTRASVCVCVCVQKLGIYARTNMSELERRLVFGIERTICALEPRVPVMNFKQSIRDLSN